MAPKDAEMPSYETLSDDIQKIGKHLSSLRGDIDKVTASVKRAGVHQAEHARDSASEVLSSVEKAVQRDPVTAIGIALGVGLLLGIVLRR
jgi:ElaB/YqjD/DUF883 family membrane-anchored ribosome-binding protein